MDLSLVTHGCDILTEEPVRREKLVWVTSTRHHPPGLSLDPRLPTVALRDDSPLGLGHDLLGDRDDVAVAHAHRAERFGKELRKIVLRADLREPLEREDLDAHGGR